MTLQQTGYEHTPRAQGKRQTIKRPYDTLAEQLLNSMNWAMRMDCFSRSVPRHDLHLSGLFSR
ncbi:MAG: hypothetical protein ABI604_20760, partial [Nitrospirota bacterium]